MKNIFKKSILTLVIVFAGAGITFAETVNQGGFRAAVVDVNAVVNSSAQVKALRLEQQAKLKELESWLVKVKSDVDKQSSKENKEKLIKKYDAEFIKKQNAIRENYSKKLIAIDKSISDTITKEANKQKYDMVFVKSTVLYGGDDITKSIVKSVK